MTLKSIFARGLLCPLFAVAVLVAKADPFLKINPEDAGRIEKIKESVFKAIPNPGYRFANWMPIPLPVPTDVDLLNQSEIKVETNCSSLQANFVPGIYTISFDANGGTPSELASLVVTNESLSAETKTGYPAFPTVEREGYKFDGWTTNDVFWTVKKGDRIWLTEDVVAKAKWTAGIYRVIFDVNDGSGNSSHKDIVFNDNYVLPDREPKRSGYEFVGWFTEVDGGCEVTEYTHLTRAEDHRLYAHWTAGRYQVTFVPGEGASVSPTFKENLAYGSPYGELPTPMREGFEFIGWYTSTSGGSLVTAETNVMTAASHSLYAHWTGKHYDITPVVSDGCTLTVAETGEFGKALDFSWTEGTKLGYTETNTTVVITAKDGSVVLAAYTNPRSPSYYTMTGTYYPAIKISVSSLFKPNEYLVWFKQPGGSSVGSKKVTYDSTYGELPTLTRTGYDFDGWFTAEDGGDEVTKDTLVKITTEQTLYAHWTAKTYTVATETEGPCSITVAQTGTFAQPLPVSWSADAIVGYSTKIKSVTIAADESGSGKVLATYTMGSGVDFTMESSYYLGIVITATAEQQENSYTVKFDANGARGKMDSISCTYDEAFDLPKQNSYTNLTAKFLGWSRDPKAAKPEWDDGAKGIKNLATDDGATVTLYAVWQDLQNELTRAAHGVNVILEGGDPDPSYGGITNSFKPVTDAQGYTSVASDLMSAMRLAVNGPGKLSFVSKMFGAETRFMLRIGSCGPFTIDQWAKEEQWGEEEIKLKISDVGDGWKRVVAEFYNDGDHPAAWYSIASEADNYWLIDQVEWLPAGWVDEPTEADRRDISAVTMENGKLAISFENADSRFAYSLHGTNDLTAARALWPVLFTTNDTGTITIKPEVKADEKQFFYYLEVHSK